MTVDWPALEQLVAVLAQPGAGPAAAQATQWQPLGLALDELQGAHDDAGLVRLRLLLVPLYARDSVTGLALLHAIDDAAIAAAERLGRDHDLGHFWGARGHNLHRTGLHRAAMDAFLRSQAHYERVGETLPALRSYYMLALCKRALGDRAGAAAVLHKVLAEYPADDPWRGNPLQVLAWLQRDAGDLTGAEQGLREALALQRRTADPDILAAGTLADLAEVLSLAGRADGAAAAFEESLAVLARYTGQYNRQEARTRLKLAEHLLRCGDHTRAARHLQQADDLIRAHGQYYDLMWRIELAQGQVFWQRRQWGGALRKWRSALRYRRLLGMPLRRGVTMLWRRLGRTWR